MSNIDEIGNLRKLISEIISLSDIEDTSLIRFDSLFELCRRQKLNDNLTFDIISRIILILGVIQSFKYHNLINYNKFIEMFGFDLEKFIKEFVIERIIIKSIHININVSKVRNVYTKEIIFNIDNILSTRYEDSKSHLKNFEKLVEYILKLNLYVVETIDIFISLIIIILNSKNDENIMEQLINSNDDIFVRSIKKDFNAMQHLNVI